VQLKELGLATREFRVDEFGAPRYPELVMVARAGEDELADRLLAALTRGYEDLGDDPDAALENLLAEVPGLDPTSQAAQLDALTSSDAFALSDSAATPELDQGSVERWRRWARENGVLGG
jgi:NitT/TauT family transport system substrate-binding protein/putative hydroxymethylpyrimidine transport system substrate-binding protein